MSDERERLAGLRQIALLTAIPAMMVVGPLLGFYLGRYLDSRLGTDPYLMVVFIVLGFAAAGREIWKLIKLASGPADEHKE